MKTYNEHLKPIDMRRSAYGVVINPFNFVLGLKNSTGLFLPGGGIDEGENPIEALKREFYEELGVGIKKASPVYHCYQNFFSPKAKKIYQGNFRYYSVGLDAMPVSSPDHTGKIVWVPYNSLWFHNSVNTAIEKAVS
jgi:8-oxo-dGTP diphosphatase